MVIISPRIWREGRATDSKRTSVWSTKGCVEMRGEMGWLFLTPLIRQITQKESPPLSMWGVGGCSLSWSWKMMCLVQMSVGADHCQWSAKQHPDVGCFHMIGDQIHVVSQVLSNAKSSCYDNGNPPVSLIIFPLKPYIRMHTVHHTGIHHCPDNLRYRQRRSLCRRHLHRQFCFWWNVGMVGHN